MTLNTKMMKDVLSGVRNVVKEAVAQNSQEEVVQPRLGLRIGSTIGKLSGTLVRNGKVVQKEAIKTSKRLVKDTTTLVNDIQKSTKRAYKTANRSTP